jgi:carbon monoxide dehydrogenase subunit G
MAFEIEVPVRHRTMWLAFTDPEKLARAVPGLTVDAVHPVPPADGPEGVAGDVIAGRLKLRIGGGGTGATITYRGTACIAGAEAQKGMLDIAVDAAQARGSGALAGYLRIALAPAGEAGERTLVSVVPELELSGRALEFAKEAWHEAVTVLASTWVEALAADYAEAVDETSADETSADEAGIDESRAEEVVAEETGAEAPVVDEPPANETPEADLPVAPEAESPVTEPAELVLAETSNKNPESASQPVSESTQTVDESLSPDPLAPVWEGRYEKNRWLPALMALALFLLIKRRRRQRAADPGADSSFWME